MSLSSTSTFDEALAQYNDNLAWVGNPTKAANLYEAVMWLYVNRPKHTEHTDIVIDYETLQHLLRKLEDYVHVIGPVGEDGTTSGRRRSSFVRARGLYP